MDDGLAAQTDGFFDERALEEADAAVEYCRLPGDPAPFAELPAGTATGEASTACFACVYGPGIRNGEKTCQGVSVYEQMLAIIDQNYGATSNRVLVDMVHAFYERELRAYFNYPEWTKDSIWEHILIHTQNDATQASESIQTMTAAIELLRVNGICKRAGDRCEIDHKNMRLYMDLTKARDALVTARARRKQ